LQPSDSGKKRKVANVPEQKYNAAQKTVRFPFLSLIM